MRAVHRQKAKWRNVVKALSYGFDERLGGNNIVVWSGLGMGNPCLSDSQKNIGWLHAISSENIAMTDGNELADVDQAVLSGGIVKTYLGPEAPPSPVTTYPVPDASSFDLLATMEPITVAEVKARLAIAQEVIPELANIDMLSTAQIDSILENTKAESIAAIMDEKPDVSKGELENIVSVVELTQIAGALKKPVEVNLLTSWSNVSMDQLIATGPNITNARKAANIFGVCKSNNVAGISNEKLYFRVNITRLSDALPSMVFFENNVAQGAIPLVEGANEFPIDVYDTGETLAMAFYNETAQAVNFSAICGIYRKQVASALPLAQIQQDVIANNTEIVNAAVKEATEIPEIPEIPELRKDEILSDNSNPDLVTIPGTEYAKSESTISSGVLNTSLSPIQGISTLSTKLGLLPETQPASAKKTIKDLSLYIIGAVFVIGILALITKKK